MWLKDGAPMAKRVTITNSDKGSQLLIPTSDWTDSGIYTISVKNIAGQESFNVEVRVTGESPNVWPSATYSLMHAIFLRSIR